MKTVKSYQRVSYNPVCMIALNGSLCDILPTPETNSYKAIVYSIQQQDVTNKQNILFFNHASYRILFFLFS